MARGERHGSKTRPERLARGERNASAKLTETDVVGVRGMALSGIGLRDISEKTGIKYITVWEIVRRKSWTHIP